MEASDIAKLVEKHKKQIQDPKIFLSARDGTLTVKSANSVGAVLCNSIKGVMPADSSLDACVGVDALASLLKAAKDISISIENGRLVVKGSRMKGDIPLETTGTPPVVPRSEQSKLMSESEIAVLSDILPLVDIPRLEKSGQLSVRCKGGELYLSCSDELHGSIYYGAGFKSELEFGVFPQDSELLRSSLSNNRVSIAQLEGRIVIRSAGEVAVIPTTECVYIQKSDSAAKPAALVDVAELRQMLSAVASIAASKDASPVRMVLSPPDSMVIQVSSPVGSLLKKLTAKVVHKATFGVSYQLLTDLVPKLSGKSKLSLFEEGNSVVRIQFMSNGVIYACLTSDDQ